jgi:hypothetical protein
MAEIQIYNDLENQFLMDNPNPMDFPTIAINGQAYDVRCIVIQGGKKETLVLTENQKEFLKEQVEKIADCALQALSNATVSKFYLYCDQEKPKTTLISALTSLSLQKQSITYCDKDTIFSFKLPLNGPKLKSPSVVKPQLDFLQQAKLYFSGLNKNISWLPNFIFKLLPEKEIQDIKTEKEHTKDIYTFVMKKPLKIDLTGLEFFHKHKIELRLKKEVQMTVDKGKKEILIRKKDIDLILPYETLVQDCPSSLVSLIPSAGIYTYFITIKYDEQFCGYLSVIGTINTDWHSGWTVDLLIRRAPDQEVFIRQKNVIDTIATYQEWDPSRS